MSAAGSSPRAGVRAMPASAEPLGDRRRTWLDRARLYVISSTRPGGSAPEDVLRPALQAGVDIVQLRDKNADDKTILRAGRHVRRLCDAYDALLIVNDRPDLALACGADGVHLGQEDTPIGEARRLLGEEMLIGQSTHSLAQIEAAGAADYIGVGPVFATPTKPGRPAVGVELVRAAADVAKVPFFAIGGIDPTNVSRVTAAGAARVAVVRAICDAEDPGGAARNLRSALDR